MSDHTNKDLVFRSGMIYTTGGTSIARMDRGEEYTTPTERDANAKRFVQIWNAWPDIMALLGDLLLNQTYYQLSDEATEQIESVLNELPLEVVR